MASPEPALSALAMPDVLMTYMVTSAETQFATKLNCIKERSDNRFFGLAYLYTCPQSPMKGSPELKREIATVYRNIHAHHEPPNNWMAPNVLEAGELLGPELRAELMPGVDALLLKSAEEFMDEVLVPTSRITHFVSPNQITSTNHMAMYASSVYRIGQLLCREDFMQMGISVWDRLVADQHPDGYWEETTGGPTIRYNHLTYCAAGRIACWAKSERYFEAAQAAARFQRRFSYPDACALETIDGRCRYQDYGEVFGDFVQSETPEGRAYVQRKMETRFRRFPPDGRGARDGADLSLIAENHQHWKHGPVGAAEADRANYVESMKEPAAMRRHGPWAISLQGVVHLPLGDHGFTIDRTSLFSLWHQDRGLIINGSGELGSTPAQSFRFDLKPHITHIPARTRLQMGAPGSNEPSRLTAEYNWGTARMQVDFLSDRDLALTVGADMRLERYPVMFTLQLEARQGTTVNGRLLTGEKLILDDAQLDGRLDFGKAVLTFPKVGAKFVWPYDPYYPYDLKNFRAPPEKYVALLHLPIGMADVCLVFRA